jgi:hypothetical protein
MRRRTAKITRPMARFIRVLLRMVVAPEASRDRTCGYRPDTQKKARGSQRKTRKVRPGH